MTTTTAPAATTQVPTAIPFTAGRITAVTAPADPTTAAAAITGLANPLPAPGPFTTLTAYLRKAANTHRRHLNGYDPTTILNRLSLTPYARRRVTTLPAPIRHLADLAAATTGAPHRIALNDPFTNLTPATTRRVMELLADLAAANCSIAIATNDHEWAEAAADTLVVLHHGHAIAQGRPTELRTRHHGPSTVTWTATDGVHEHRTRTPGAVVAELEAHFGNEIHTITITPPTLTDAITNLTNTHNH